LFGIVLVVQEVIQTHVLQISDIVVILLMILKKPVMMEHFDLMLVQIYVQSHFVVMLRRRVQMDNEEQRYVMMEILMRMMDV
jgi:hypothetical protein